MKRSWSEANQRHLARALSEVRACLERQLGERSREPDRPTSVDGLAEAGAGAGSGPAPPPAADFPPPAIEVLSDAFSLSQFERDVLLLCAGVELDSRFAALCAKVQGDAAREYPTFSLALVALRGAHWSALSPDATLRRWHLIEVAGAGGGAGVGGDAVTTSPLRVDERILHFLAGVPGTDERLRGVLELVRAAGDLPPSHDAVAQRMAALWTEDTVPGIGSGADEARPVLQLCGRAGTGRSAIAAAAASVLGLRLQKIAAREIPLVARERELMTRLCEREAILTGSALLIEADEGTASEGAHQFAAFAKSVGGIVAISVREPIRVPGRAVVRLDVPEPTTEERRALWRTVLGPAAGELNGELENVVAHFDLNAREMRAVAADLRSRQSESDGEVATMRDTVWDACRAQGRPDIGSLAQRIEPVATWNEIVLPEAQLRTLREIALHVRRRGQVHHAWGFAAKGARGLGISALFSGPSGTGKTMAAEVLANELRLDLYRIDLSQVVSKYIGETEKNLRRVFETTEGSGAILLFDEADALFGRRSEVKDSHDRYANIEISYLLQGMEAYRGLAILTTNMKNALDAAFLRRIRFLVQFPFPGAAERAEIWRRVFPAETPTEGLDFEKLARLNIPGGNIRNIAMNSAFLAAGDGTSVRMGHLLRAARSEYEKIEKPLTASELADWK